MEFLAWLEQTNLSAWVRGSLYGFPITLTFHALAMGFLVGSNIAMDLRILGVAPGVPVNLMARFLPVIRVSFVVSLLSGLLLLAAYPAKALTNSVFYLKFLLIVLALLVTRAFSKQIFDSSSAENVSISAFHRTLAIGSLLLWAGAITSGRFLAYTHSILMASDF